MSRVTLVCLLFTLLAITGLNGAVVNPPPSGPGGVVARCNLPLEMHLKNKGGNDRTRSNPRGLPGQGSGLCVFTSINHSAQWQNVEALQGFRDWMTNHPGGGWPDKVDQMIELICKERAMPKPRYLQVEGRDLEILKKAVQSGRMPGVTFGYSPAGRYDGRRISHMVSLVHADDQHFAILDNNYPGTFEWMTPKEFLGAYTDTGGYGWAVILLDPGPPPAPWNQRKEG